MKLIKDIIRGIVIGIANAVPGVSGGTMMVSMGIYDDIIYCITHLFSQLKKSLKILAPYMVGMVIGIVGLAFAIEYLNTHFPFQTSMVFIGLILGGVPILWKRVRGEEKQHKLHLGHGIVFLLFCATIIILGLPGIGQNSKDVVLTVGIIPGVLIFLVGIVASATMVIPGVSGSMMLMLMGYYNPIIEAITGFIKGAVKGDWHTVLTVSGSLVPFGLGVVIGIFAIAKLIEILLKKFESLTYCAILGLVAASPVVILMKIPLHIDGITLFTGAIALAAGGFVASHMSE